MIKNDERVDYSNNKEGSQSGIIAKVQNQLNIATSRPGSKDL